MKHLYKLCLVLGFLLVQTVVSAQVYYASDDSLWLLPPNEKEPTLIIDDRAEGIVADTAAGYLFWTVTYLEDVVKRSNLDGTEVEVIVDNSGNYAGIVADPENEKIYWANNQNDGEILRSNYDGTEVETILSGETGGITDGVQHLYLDSENERIYWSNFAAIMRASLDGDNIETIRESNFIQQNDLELKIDDGYLYWVHSANNYIMRIDLDSHEEVEILQSTDITSIDVDLNSGKIYWVNNYMMSGNGGEIQRANLDGSNQEQVITTGFTEGAFYVVSGHQLATSKEENENEILPSSIVLHKNYPNPFNPQTTIQYQLPKMMSVSLNIYNFLGQKIHSLVQNETQSAGMHAVKFDASDIPSGIYFYRLETVAGSYTGRMTLIK